MDYYRVRAAHKTWTDKGPDLLRPMTNALAATRDIMRDHTGFSTRWERTDGTLTDWQKASRAQVVARFRAWVKSGTETFQVGDREGGDVAPLVVVKHERVRKADLAHCSPATERVHSLFRHQWPDSIFSGGFLYRQVDGSTAWSDHAWGTALDESQNEKKGVRNDETFDWIARMGREGCVEYDYALGSRDGKVMAASAPGYDPRPSSAASSHLWHVHISVVDHDGAKPPRNPMYT